MRYDHLPLRPDRDTKQTEIARGRETVRDETAIKMCASLGLDAETSRVSAERLLQLARERSRESRELLAEVMVALLQTKGEGLDSAELRLIDDVLRTLLQNVERTVRERLANALSRIDGCPRDLIWFLATERIDVAYPILLRSKALEDNDLIELVYQTALEHRIAIARRPHLSAVVSDALAQVGETDVIVELLNNATARLAKATLNYIVERAREEKAFHEPLLRRPDLTPEMASRLYAWVSAALRRYVLKHWDIAPELIDDGLQAALQSDFPDGREADPADDLAQAVAEDGSKFKRLMMSSVEAGDLRLVVSLISTALGLRKTLVRRILLERTSESLCIVCQALGLSRKECLDFLAVLSEARKGLGTGHDAPDLAALGAFFDRIDEETARHVIAHWGREQTYLGAVRALEIVQS